MSRTPYFFVEKFNSDKGCYELCHPYVWYCDNTELIPADLFPYNGCHDVFSIVENCGQDFPKMYGIHKGLPLSVSKEVRDAYIRVSAVCEYNPTSPIVRWFTYADMYIYLLKNPTVLIRDDDEEQSIDNPIKKLKLRVDSFLNIVNDDWDECDGYSRVRIVYWML